MIARRVAALALAALALAGCEATDDVSLPPVPSPSELATTLPPTTDPAVVERVSAEWEPVVEQLRQAIDGAGGDGAWSGPDEVDGDALCTQADRCVRFGPWATGGIEAADVDPVVAAVDEVLAGHGFPALESEQVGAVLRYEAATDDATVLVDFTGSGLELLLEVPAR